MFYRVVICLAVGLAPAGWSASYVLAAAAEELHAEQPGGQHESDVGGHGGGDGHGDVDLNPLTWNRDLAIWTAVVFVALFLTMKYAFWGRIAEGLDKREQGIADEISAAEKSNADARDVLQQYQDKLTASEEEIRQMIEAGKRDAEKIGDGIVEKARAEGEANKRRALEEIDLATDGALKDLAERSASLAVDLAGKIVSQTLDRQAHSGMIEKAISRFSETPSKN